LQALQDSCVVNLVPLYSKLYILCFYVIEIHPIQSKIISEPKCTTGGSGVPVALVEWRRRRRRETGGVSGLLRWASAFAAGAAESV